MSAEVGRLQGLLERLEKARATLAETEDPEAAIEVMNELAQIGKEVEAELARMKREADAGA